MSGDADELAAARLAIFALSAISQVAENVLPCSEMALEVNGSLLDEEAAALYLAGLAKPLECRSEAVAETYRFSCQPLTVENRWIYDSVGKEAGDDQNRVRDGSAAREHCMIAVKNPCGLLLVWPREVFERFERDYIIVGSYLRTGREPSEVQKEQGIVQVIGFAGPAFRTQWF